MNATTTATTQVSHWFDSQHSAMQDFLQKIVDISSHSWNPAGVEQVQALMERQLIECGLTTRRVPSAAQFVKDGEKQSYADHVLARTTAASRAKYVILSGHTDTVHEKKGGFVEFKVDPNDETRAGGPGAYDMKGGVVVILWALKALHEAGCLAEIPITVILNSEEEVGCPDARTLFEEEASGASVALVFESGREEDVLVVQRKTWAKYIIEVQGRSAHAGTSLGDGHSALEQLARLVPQLNALRSERERITANVGVFHSGTQSNVVPDFAEAEFEIRAPTDELLRDREGECHRICGQTFLSGTRTDVRNVCTVPAMPLLPGTKGLCDSYTRAGSAAGLSFRVEERVIGGFSNANFFANAGVPTLDALGVNGGNAHSTDEFMLLPSLVPRAKTLAFWLLDFARQ